MRRGGIGFFYPVEIFLFFSGTAEGLRHLRFGHFS